MNQYMGLALKLAFVGLVAYVALVGFGRAPALGRKRSCDKKQPATGLRWAPGWFSGNPADGSNLGAL
jgi:hypothetical protein